MIKKVSTLRLKENYLPLIGRILLVSTFIEDAFRILVQWNEQIAFMREYRGFSFYGVSQTMLLFNVLLMFSCSLSVIIKRNLIYACVGLIAVVLLQTLEYGLVWHFAYLLRNFSLIGSLLLLSSYELKSKQMESTKSKGKDIPFYAFMKYSSSNSSSINNVLVLIGRALILSLFVSLLNSDDLWFLNNGTGRIILFFVLICSVAMILVGFKAVYSAIFLFTFLTITNFALNNYWSIHSGNPRRDFIKYDFFQTLSVMGGLLLLISIGPGHISVDEKNKKDL